MTAPPVDRRGQPIDIVSGVDLRHAIERALAELRELLRQILAAEDLVLLAQRLVDLGDAFAGAVEIDDELLEEAARERASSRP